MDWISFGTMGSSTLLTTGVTVWSCDGERALNASLYCKGTTTSFTSGLPSRDTWWKAPHAVADPLSDRLVDRRSVVDQTPTTGLCVGSWPSATSDCGTWSTIVLTL